MCYGNLDPKLMMRDMENRLGSVATEHDPVKKTAPAWALSPLAVVRAAIGRLMRKGPSHV
jgi:hypothetical protein